MQKMKDEIIPKTKMADMVMKKSLRFCRVTSKLSCTN